jgi:hypothetical protein
MMRQSPRKSLQVPDILDKYLAVRRHFEASGGLPTGRSGRIFRALSIGVNPAERRRAGVAQG